MITYADRTFCSSPNCKNECGRYIDSHQITKAREMGLPIAWSEFCDENGKVKTEKTT